VEALPAGARLVPVTVDTDLDLDALTVKLAAMREELRLLGTTPAVPDDIGARISAYVSNLAAKALPLVRHTSGTLECQFPMAPDATLQNGGFSVTDGNALMLAAALNPKQLGELILKAVQRAQPLSEKEHAARRVELEREIDRASYVTAAILEAAGEPLR
jgi:hypothetical protein